MVSRQQRAVVVLVREAWRVPQRHQNHFPIERVLLKT
jgi:hypothetical protein